MKRTSRVLILGPIGVGKSKFCNFIRKDLKNSINKVSYSLDSSTDNFNLNAFTRNKIDFEFIDSPGFSEESYKIDYFKKLINYLKSLESLDYILLMFNFGERIRMDVRNYIEFLGKIFNKKDLSNHLNVVFTRKELFKNEINKILKGLFNIKVYNDFKVYFIDTEIPEEEDEDEDYIIYQEIVDGLLKQIKEDADKFNSIDTKDINLY